MDKGIHRMVFLLQKKQQGNRRSDHSAIEVVFLLHRKQLGKGNTQDGWYSANKECHAQETHLALPKMPLSNKMVCVAL